MVGDANITLPDRALRELVRRASNFLSKIASPAADEIGGWLGERFAIWRVVNTAKALDKAREKLSVAGIAPRVIPLRVLGPVLDRLSWEDNEDMQEKWANLLAKAADPNYSYDNTLLFANILGQLSPIEGMILDKLYKKFNSAAPDKRGDALVHHGEIIEDLGLDVSDYEIILQKFESLMLLLPGVTSGSERGYTLIGGGAFTKRERFSVLGAKFLAHVSAS